MEEKLKKYRNQLSQDFPELNIKNVSIIGSGWHHDAVLVDSSIVFRIPRGIHDSDSVTETEIALLKHLKGRLDVQTPDPKYIQKNGEYFGYPIVVGNLLDELVDVFDDNDWAQMKMDWVNLASSIHTALDVEKARKLGVVSFIQPGPQWAEGIFELQDVDEDILIFAKKVLKQYNDINLDSLPNVFIHNDLQFHNILANPKTKRISGIIDWTDACIGPVSREFAISEWCAKPALLEEVIRLYQEQTGVPVDAMQVRMWRNLEELGDYVENTKLGQTVQARKTLARIKEHIKSESAIVL